MGVDEEIVDRGPTYLDATPSREVLHDQPFIQWSLLTVSRVWIQSRNSMDLCWEFPVPVFAFC
jgi:hypothetical protein